MTQIVFFAKFGYRSSGLCRADLVDSQSRGYSARIFSIKSTVDMSSAGI
ncbi:unnamed protein product [Acanthoscelides obtectus]|uniref:Uncharacterized protein n=1 Tax=Acanthoscelides obtectus TaxID=200917 RepID=A0A9P0Q303_ACAOB|nr:unnamed protein product [Acanthoscelides obtectus]CAK1650178.1 hypothetical protein AOBTE_LOCUS16663 [Acanthoscelides obtectus]